MDFMLIFKFSVPISIEFRIMLIVYKCAMWFSHTYLFIDCCIWLCALCMIAEFPQTAYIYWNSQPHVYGTILNSWKSATSLLAFICWYNVYPRLVTLWIFRSRCFWKKYTFSLCCPISIYNSQANEAIHRKHYNVFSILHLVCVAYRFTVLHDFPSSDEHNKDWILNYNFVNSLIHCS